MAIVMKGIEVVNSMKEKLLGETARLKEAGINPSLAIVRLGARLDDLSYEKGAVKRCEGLGISCKVVELPDDTSQENLIKVIKRLNDDSDTNGILLFRPLPKQIEEKVIKYVISPEKDVDCLSPVNVAKVFEGDESGYAPCTPEAVIELLDHYKINVKGKKVTVVGRSMVVGKPLSMLLLKRHATVTICHTRTTDLEGTCRSAEILIAAAGKAKMLDSRYISPGQIVIDVGINVDAAGNLCGDVDFESVSGIAGYITPVPGGIGTVTTSVLAKHIIQAAARSAAAS
ncbi:MAG: tetrahydrofolate dehydrogenase/cyclohydrolase catalytic domain-containing protein [Clostridiales bacterium]|nr:tetrahydrofolate dehydrogenase/cyclohydrolase catalytic domain-containing protein [Clostridiales bacterium]